MVDYEINEETLAVVPFRDKTKVYELNQTYIVDKPVNVVMEDSCAYFGSTLEGRQKGTSALIGVTHKAPIIVEESKEIIFFPTTSPRLDKCCWISLKNIDSYYRENGELCVVFKSGQVLKLDVSYGIIDNQVLRATRLESVLRKRKQKK